MTTASGCGTVLCMVEITAVLCMVVVRDRVVQLYYVRHLTAVSSRVAVLVYGCGVLLLAVLCICMAVPVELHFGQARYKNRNLDFELGLELNGKALLWDAKEFGPEFRQKSGTQPEF